MADDDAIARSKALWLAMAQRHTKNETGDIEPGHGQKFTKPSGILFSPPGVTVVETLTEQHAASADRRPNRKKRKKSKKKWGSYEMNLMGGYSKRSNNQRSWR